MGPDSDRPGGRTLSGSQWGGGVQSGRPGGERCQSLYFLPILRNVKIHFKIFKSKLLEWYFAEEQSRAPRLTGIPASPEPGGAPRTSCLWPCSSVPSLASAAPRPLLCRAVLHHLPVPTAVSCPRVPSMHVAV